MASIEKLAKAFEALKVIQTPIDRPEEALVSTKFMYLLVFIVHYLSYLLNVLIIIIFVDLKQFYRKRETSLTKKDKTIHCNTIADIICCPSLRFELIYL